MTPPLVLASSSPRRRDLLAQWGYRFDVVPADVEEVSPPGESPAGIVLHNARLKCRAVTSRHPDRVVLGVDTLVAFEGGVLGKPTDMADAERMLARLNGQTHEVYSGVLLRMAASDWEEEFVTVSRVTFHTLDAAGRRRYLDRIGPLDKAGAYAAQDDSGVLIAGIDGSRTNVIGLPMEDLVPRLERCRILPHP